MLSKYRARLQLLKCLIFCHVIMISMAHANTHHPQDFLDKIKDSKDAGKSVYEHFCSVCHNPKPQILLGAPRSQVHEDWVMRTKTGLNALIKNTHEGFNAMPPRGGCFECSDEQLFAALLYMLPSEEKKQLSNQIGAHKKIIK